MSDLNCSMRDEERAELLLAYTAGRLDAGKAAGLDRHMEQCGACARFRSSQQLVWDALDSWQAPEARPDFNRRLYRRIEEEARAPWYRRLVTTPLAIWKPALPLATACLLVVAGFVYDHPASRPAAQSPSVSVSPTEAEQVESALDDMQLLRQLDNSGVSPTGSL